MWPPSRRPNRHCVIFPSGTEPSGRSDRMGAQPSPVFRSVLIILRASDRPMKMFTIAQATAKSAIRQPAFFVLAGLASALLIITIFVPYFTFNEDIKMYKDSGLATISFIGLLLALLTASSTVAEEIEGKTAITLLSKPINRRQF